ncbi:MAG: hypothetical protein O3B13_11170 [Planctomycetota bacterium]|nr:hypothetical protein [Planctomycetota bacterium]
MPKLHEVFHSARHADEQKSESLLDEDAFPDREPWFFAGIRL